MKSKVFFTKQISGKSVLDLYNLLNVRFDSNQKIGVKTHFGEEGNKNYIDPDLLKPLCKQLNANLVETNVLYVSKRRYTESHIKLAKEHGFDFAEIDILDSEKDALLNVETPLKEVKIGANTNNYNGFVVVSHFKGHGMAGFGGAIKNIGMGMASVAGKMAMHATGTPVYNEQKCVLCGRCVKKCPVNAISLNPLKIDENKCIGCGACIGECPHQVFGVPWSSVNHEEFISRLVQYAAALHHNYKMVYINVLAKVSSQCDCLSNAPKPFVEDIGIVASTDILAVEKASLDLVNKHSGCEDAFLTHTHVSGNKQLEYGLKYKMGSLDYELVNLD